MKDQWQALLNKEMSRAEFLRYMGSIFLAVIGVSGLLKTMLHSQTSTVITRRVENVQGYGASAYGGAKRK